MSASRRSLSQIGAAGHLRGVRPQSTYPALRVPAVSPPDQRLSPAPITHRSIVAGRGSPVTSLGRATLARFKSAPGVPTHRHAGPSLRARRRPRPVRFRHRARLRSPVAYSAVSNNPADALAELPIEDSVYDPATKCSARPKPGMTALVKWLTRNAAGAFWGTYRCEKWGKHSASLHAEGRAVDWALDVAVPAQREGRREADRALPRPGPPRPAAGARPPHGRRGDHLGLRLLGRGHGPVPPVLALPVQARQAAPQGRQDDRPPRPPAHRPDQGRRGQARPPSGRAALPKEGQSLFRNGRSATVRSARCRGIHRTVARARPCR